MPHTFRNAPEPPYFAVIFMAKLAEAGLEGYKELGDQLLDQARQQPGFLGYDDLCAGTGHSFNVSYWENLESIKQWKRHNDHLAAQKLGREKWYQCYEIKIARVERSYSFPPV